MTLAELKHEIEECSQEDIQRVREKGTKEAEKIIKKAEEQAKMIKMSHLEDAERKVNIERTKLLAVASAEMHIKLNQEKERIYQQAFLETGKILSKLREKNSYENFFRNSFDESVRAIDEGELTLHIDQRDRDLCQKIVNETNLRCEVTPDLECSGGMIASTEHDRIVVHNTLESRVERAKEVMKLEIYSLLYR